MLVLVISGVLGVHPVDAIAQAGNASSKTGDVSRALKLDEAQLTPLMRFDASLLGDESQACKDFDAYANGKWLTANRIPGDEVSWGSWDMLGKRSESVQKQLAEQAAADVHPTGTRKIVADFWASGMDQAQRDALGVKPVQTQLDEIDALKEAKSIAAYCAKTRPREAPYHSISGSRGTSRTLQ